MGVASLIDRCEEQRKAENRAENQRDILEMAATLRQAREQGHDCGNPNCFIRGTLFILEAGGDDWERLLEPLAGLVCDVDAAVTVLQAATGGPALVLKSDAMFRRLQKAREAGHHRCSDPDCRISLALTVLQGCQKNEKLYWLTFWLLYKPARTR